MALLDLFALLSHRQECCIIHNLLQVRTRKIRGFFGKVFPMNGGESTPCLGSMDFQNFHPTLLIRTWNVNLPIESSQDRGIQDFGPIRSRNDNDSNIFFVITTSVARSTSIGLEETVHLCQELIQGLIAFVVAISNSAVGS